MIDQIFDLCVILLIHGANLLDMTYKAINVWIFVIIWPIFMVILIALIVQQRLALRRSEARFRALQAQRHK